LLGSYARIAFPGDESDDVTRSACQRIIDLYDAWGNPAKVAEWQAKLRLEQGVGD